MGVSELSDIKAQRSQKIVKGTPFTPTTTPTTQLITFTVKSTTNQLGVKGTIAI